MRKLVLGALLIGSLAMTSGCIITSDDDDDGGRFSLTWSLTAGVGGADISCSDAGATGVSSIATLAGTTSGFDDIFTCGDGQGTTGILPLGDYTVVVSVLGLDDNGDEIALGTSLPRSESLIDPGVTEDLGDFTFAFNANGDLDFGVDYGAAGGDNCNTGAGGAGDEIVEDQNTNLVLMGSTQCIGVQLLLGGNPDTDDICSEIPLCVEPTVVQTLVDLEPDVYELQLDGLFDFGGGSSVACFKSIDIFEITDGDEDLGVLNVPFDDTEDPTNCSTI